MTGALQQFNWLTGVVLGQLGALHAVVEQAAKDGILRLSGNSKAIRIMARKRTSTRYSYTRTQATPRAFQTVSPVSRQEDARGERGTSKGGILSDIEGLRLKQIAEGEGLTVSAVESRVQRGRRMLENAARVGVFRQGRRITQGAPAKHVASQMSR